MTIRDYLKLREISVEAFAKEAGINMATIYRCLNGSHPNARTIGAIIKATRGAIRADDLIPGLIRKAS